MSIWRCDKCRLKNIESSSLVTHLQLFTPTLYCSIPRFLESCGVKNGSIQKHEPYESSVKKRWNQVGNVISVTVKINRKCNYSLNQSNVTGLGTNKTTLLFCLCSLTLIQINPWNLSVWYHIYSGMKIKGHTACSFHLHKSLDDPSEVRDGVLSALVTAKGKRFITLQYPWWTCDLLAPLVY